MEPGILARVLHDFLTTIDGELSLCKGDYFQVHKIVDKHWCYGQSYNRSGNFPLSHLHKIEIPEIADTQTLFVSIAAFPGEQTGDLSFGPGEVIVGIREVGAEWHLGQIDSRIGIFPTSHVWEADSTLIKKANSGKKSIRRKAKVKVTLKAQLKEELDLTEGEVVTVTEILEDGWCRGVTEDGREGTFPEGFVVYLAGDSTDRVDACHSLENASALAVSAGAASDKDADSLRWQGSVEAESELEAAPDYYDLYPELRASTISEKDSKSNTQDVGADSFEVKPYAITLYPFSAQFPNELSFDAGEVVHLAKHIDSEWMEGSIDNTKGIFPMSYVNIIVDCSEGRDQIPVNQEAGTAEYDGFEPGTVAKVEYTFKAQMNGDLNVSEGDTVVVLEMANQDWVKVKNESGDTGMCPRGYLNPTAEPAAEASLDSLEDFVVLRHDRSGSSKNEEQKAKRLSEPHRPAPPVPAPGSTLLQKQRIGDQDSSEGARLDEDRVCNAIDTEYKRADQRQNVISELVLTEKEYVRDLKLMYETFNLYNPHSLESKGIDVAILFGNILEVIHVAEELLDMILKAMKGCDENLQKVGPSFLKMSDKLKIIYVKYCGNHEAALALLKKYESNEEIMATFNKGIETLRYQIACFDMSSILIKPVQRILKYPLILYELVKCTENDHPDKAAVEEAWKAMTEVASYINEYKRRKDLVSKYLDNDNTLIRKMAKLNMHSVAKMSARLSTKLSATLGLTNVVVDPVFDELERQFRSIEKCTLQLAKDVEQCVVYLSDEAISCEIISDFLIQYYQGIPNTEIKRFRDTRSLIWSQYVRDLKSSLEKRVTAPVHFLATLLEGPAVLITKRYDKLLDYDAAISKSEKYKESKIVQDELSMTKSNFEALNQQLLEELPILIDAAKHVLVSCIDAFANIRKLLSGKITKQYLKLCESTMHLSSQDILETFMARHAPLLIEITSFTFAGTNPRITEEEKSNGWSPQSEGHRILLKNKYLKEKLFVVMENVRSTTSLDIGAAKGTLVAVIKNQDPMGDTTRWYVDNGIEQGFLPAFRLQPFLRFPPTKQESTETDADENDMPDLICMNSPTKEKTNSAETNLEELLALNESSTTDQNYANIEEISETRHYQNLSCEFYYALYDFNENMPGTLPVVKGQALRLLESHDVKGNVEWWLVENRFGQTGYVPQNYLSPASTLNQ